jgi:glutathione S-transferase
MAFAEKGLDFESHVIRFGEREHLSDAYLKINPNGVVPTLVHDGRPVVDSSVICEYLDEAFGGASLSPAGAIERAQMRAWMRYFEEVPTVAIRVPSFNIRFMAAFGAMPATVFDEMTAKMPLRRHFYLEMGQKGFSDARFQESIERLRACLQRVSKALEAGGPWIMGEQFTIADIVLIPSIIRMLDLGLEAQWEDLPAIQKWLDDVMARPSFDQAYYEGTRMRAEDYAKAAGKL